MKDLVWLKPGIYGAAIGSIALAVVGFAWGGWVTGSTAEKMSTQRAQAEVVSALVPFCIAQSKADPLHDERIAELAKASTYQRGDILMKAGWATMPGASEPNRDVALACLDQLAVKS